MQKIWEAGDNISGAPAPGGDHGPLTHEKVNTQSTRNIKMRQHLCVVHALPRTRLTNAILYENSSQERHLEMKLTGNQDRLKRQLSSLVAFIGLICSYFINFCLVQVVFFLFWQLFCSQCVRCVPLLTCYSQSCNAGSCARRLPWRSPSEPSRRSRAASGGSGNARTR